MLVDGGDGGVGHLARVGEAAGVLLGVGGHDRDVFFPHFHAMELAAGLEAGRDAHILGEEADGLDGELGSFVSGLAGRILTVFLLFFGEACA